MMFYNDMQHINGKDGYTVDLKGMGIRMVHKPAKSREMFCIIRRFCN